MALQPLGSCSYNGYAFSAHMETAALKGTPMYDQAGRTVVYTQWMLTIRDKIGAAPGDTLDATIEDARQRLLIPGGALFYSGKGFGQLTINTANPGVDNVKDVLWGPKPRSFDYRILGRDLGGEITWTVEVNIPQCEDAIFQLQLMERAFTVSWDIDKSGYTRRTINGYIRIPSTRPDIASRVLSDNADKYRHLITFDTPSNFRRIPGNFSIDEAKTRLDFSIVDEEMPPNIPPPGVIEVSASHSVQSDGMPALSTRWTNTVSASYEMAKDARKETAYAYFLQLLTSRILAAKENGTVGLVTSISLAESEIYGRKTANFTANYWFTVDKKKILKASGLWQPVPNSDYHAWKQSLALIFSKQGRGYAQLQFANDDDLIVDLCAQGGEALAAAGTGPADNVAAVSAEEFQNVYPDPDAGYVYYTIAARIDLDDQVVEMKPLPLGPIQSAEGTAITLTDPAAGQSAGSPVQDPSFGNILHGKTDDFTLPYPAGMQLSMPQQRAAPSVSITLLGRALRAGWPINAPSLALVGGVKPIPANIEGRNYFWKDIIRNWFGVPVMAAQWSLRWVLPTMPNGPVKTPPNLFVS